MAANCIRGSAINVETRAIARGEELGEVADALATFKARMGFMANSGRIMARRPKIVFALADLARAIMAEGDVSFGMKSLIGQVASWASGCLYCQAHFANNILRAGIEDDKLDNLWNFERSELFSEKETRDFAFRDGPPRSGPNAVTDADSRS
ncbi:MAG: carboxymuconolactone decarboxylase family protein [Terricaulis sp.]